MINYTNYTYNPNTPINTVFSVVDKVRELCILTKQPKSDSQLTNIAYIIFNKPRFFKESLKTWNKATSNKTYSALKYIYAKSTMNLNK